VREVQKEKLKTVILTVFVFTSLLLSLGIWRITPQFEAIDGPQFSSNVGLTDPIYQRTLTAVTAPRQAIIHLGDNHHTVLFPGESGYQESLDLLRSASFFDVKITTDYGEDEWAKIVKGGQSLQFEFDTPMSGPNFEQSKLIKFTSNAEPLLTGRTLYLFKQTGDNDWSALFYSGADLRMYTARVMVPADKQAKLFETAKNNPPYDLFGQSLHKNFYLPSQPEKIASYTAEVDETPHIERLIDTFFVDNNLTRRVYEKDGSQILTDGSRSVRFGKQDRTLLYRNLGQNKRGGVSGDADTGITTALTFVNEHGGFSGSSIFLHEVRSNLPKRGVQGAQFYEFRQHVYGLPVMGQLSSVYVRVDDQEVAAMKRSQYALGKLYKLKDVQLLSGSELLAHVQKSGGLIDRNKITSTYLAYLVQNPREGLVDLRPVYVVEQASDARSAIFDAQTGEQILAEEGDLRGLE
jgi:regulatory protein YycH of two-component signal transduction system YycFG